MYFWGRRSLSNPTDEPHFLVFFLSLRIFAKASDWRKGSDHVISAQPVQQGPTRSDSTGPSHSSLSECGVPSIHQLCQALPPPRPETVHIQASLHSSHMLEPLTATLMFLFIRPFITLEVKIQMHYYCPYNKPASHSESKKKKKISGLKCGSVRTGLFSICLCRFRRV